MAVLLSESIKFQVITQVARNSSLFLAKANWLNRSKITVTIVFFTEILTGYIKK
ncbi:hypothetical protein BMS3Abin05_01607 [bacterium BMS3Abin05]|nr:hypothetical protein BMS3Abin05_01607 [bacterium BMS3Abin05]